jgi:DNA-damage-inducible protein J
MSELNDRINARIDPALKQTAEAIFSRLGMSSGEAIRMFYAQVALNHGMPFPVRIPNRETRKSLADAKKGKGKRYKSTKELFESWDRLDGKD